MEEEKTDEEQPLNQSLDDTKESENEQISAENPTDDRVSNQSSSEEEGLNFFNLSKEKKFTILTFCFANFCVGAFYSLLAPFFPQEVGSIFFLHFKEFAECSNNHVLT